VFDGILYSDLVFVGRWRSGTVHDDNGIFFLARGNDGQRF
jgi:hypothetical protein